MVGFLNAASDADRTYCNTRYLDDHHAYVDKDGRICFAIFPYVSTTGKSSGKGKFAVPGKQKVDSEGDPIGWAIPYTLDGSYGPPVDFESGSWESPLFEERAPAVNRQAAEPTPFKKSSALTNQTSWAGRAQKNVRFTNEIIDISSKESVKDLWKRDNSRGKFKPVDKKDLKGLNRLAIDDSIRWETSRKADGGVKAPFVQEELTPYTRKVGNKIFLTLDHGRMTYNPRLKENPDELRAFMEDHGVFLKCDGCNGAKVDCTHLWPCSRCHDKKHSCVFRGCSRQGNCKYGVDCRHAHADVVDFLHYVAIVETGAELPAGTFKHFFEEHPLYSKGQASKSSTKKGQSKDAKSGNRPSSSPAPSQHQALNLGN